MLYYEGLSLFIETSLVFNSFASSSEVSNPSDSGPLS
jgi:hypothetical protein